jgi:hypothetical protein
MVKLFMDKSNVLGALNAITHEWVMVTNDTYVNASTVCE